MHIRTYGVSYRILVEGFTSMEHGHLGGETNTKYDRVHDAVGDPRATFSLYETMMSLH